MGQRIRQRPFLVHEIDTSSGQLFSKGSKAPTKVKPDWDVYVDRLRNLLPIEVTAMYLAGLGVIPLTERASLLGWVVFCLFATVLYTARQSRQHAGSTKHAPLPIAWRQVLIAAVSFLVWSYALGEPYRQLGVWVAHLSTLFMLGWTFLAPFLYSGEPT